MANSWAAAGPSVLVPAQEAPHLQHTACDVLLAAVAADAELAMVVSFAVGQPVPATRRLVRTSGSPQGRPKILQPHLCEGLPPQPAHEQHCLPSPLPDGKTGMEAGPPLGRSACGRDPAALVLGEACPSCCTGDALFGVPWMAQELLATGHGRACAVQGGPRHGSLASCLDTVPALRGSSLSGVGRTQGVQCPEHCVLCCHCCSHQRSMGLGFLGHCPTV